MKGQVTLFIIIGVVVLIAIAIPLMYFATTMQKRVGGLGKGQAGVAVVKQVSDYVTSCLSLVSAEALKNLGEQNALYASEGGTVPDFLPSELGSKYLYDPVTEKRVAYAVSLEPPLNLAYEGGSLSNRAPAYPWTTFPHNPFQEGNTTYYASSTLGWVRLPPLEGEGSIQAMLQNFTKNNMRHCGFERFSERGVDIIAGNPFVNVTFSTSGTVFALNWPLSVTGDTSAELSEFEIIHPVRFRTLYALLRYLVDNEVGNFDFNLSQQPSAEFMQLNEQGTLTKVTDTLSRLEGEPYTYSLAVPNRPPALWYFSQEILDSTIVCVNTVIKWGGKFTLWDGGTPGNPCDIDVKLDARAVDPDEQQISISVLDAFRNSFSQHAVTSSEIQSKCALDYEVQAFDGSMKDCQRLCVRLRSPNECPVPCDQPVRCEG